jgi:glucosamine--fructose-6-phosphate aminotransferase (isomerizing)
MDVDGVRQNLTRTIMFEEAASAGAVVRTVLARNAGPVASLAERLRAFPPAAVLMVGRGSSDHAGVYAKYLIETQLGILSSPAGLSVSSIYSTSLVADGLLCLAISQSGRSPDLLAAVDRLAARGGRVVALVNDEESPLANAATQSLPLHAGPERSVAATKSFIAALAAVAQLVAHWADDRRLLGALNELPDLLDAAWALDWSEAETALGKLESFYVLGRGPGYAVAREAALKFKETCGIHAESYSAAEVLHGPAALMGPKFPALAFCQDDDSHRSMAQILGTLADRGAPVFAAGLDQPGIVALPTVKAHPLLQPILMAASFYRMVNAVSVGRGRDPDRPPFLSKVTETL